MPGINYKNLSSGEVLDLKIRRWKCRTDLEYLCREVLNYPDVCREVHGPILDAVQHFPRPTKEQFQKSDVLVGGNWVYEPLVKLYALQGHRRTLIIDPRGFLKSTINAISHTIQWILNYPDVRILIVQATAERAEALVSEIKGHFQGNELLRALFPEHCPQKKIWDWGTKAQFTTEARQINRKEETVMTCSIDKSATGYHFDVMKFSDIVDDRNSIQDSQLQAVIKQFGAMENLVDRPESWIDVEGTIYSHSDLYTKLTDLWEEEKKKGMKHKWHIHIRGCYKKDTKKKGYQFTPDERALKDLEDETTKSLENPQGKVSWWPDRWPVEELESYRREHGQRLFSCHKLNFPSAGDDEKTPFPTSEESGYPKIIRPDKFKENVRVAYYKTTVDTAETKEETSDFSVITTCAWDGFGRCYVVEVIRDKMLPDELCKHIIMAYIRWKPMSILIEETGYVRGLMPTLRRYEDLEGVVLPVSFLKRENTQAKKERILNTLQPWYKAGNLRFVDDGSGSNLAAWEHIIQELSRFPTYRYDDILDTLADQFQDKGWFGRERAKPTFKQYQADEFEKMLGTEIWDPDKPDQTEISLGPGSVL